MFVSLSAYKLRNILLQLFLLKPMRNIGAEERFMQIFCENANIFIALYLTKKWTAVIFESKSTRRREIKRLKCSSKQQQQRRKEKVKKL